MSNLTQNLNLFKYDVEDDGKQVFDIDMALNQNWDIIDTFYKDTNINFDTLQESLESYINKTDPKVKLYVVSMTIGTSTWYRKWSNGMVEQGGTTTWSNASNTNKTITLAVTHSNANYHVAAQGLSSQGTPWIGFMAYRTSASQIRFGWYGNAGSDTCNGVGWYTVGL